MDERGRIPFAVLGLLLILGSIITSGIITSLQKEYSRISITSLEGETLKYFIKQTEIDLARILSYSCLEALDHIGKNPVIETDFLAFPLAKKYNGEGENVADKDGNGKIEGFNEYIQFNKNIAREIARINFNRYIESFFRNDKYNNGEFAINADYINSWNEIKFFDVKMAIGDKKPFFLPDKEYTVYWKAVINNYEIEIKNLTSRKSVRKNICIETIIPSRLPLLMEITNEFENKINGFLTPLNGFVSLVGFLYGEGRALLQWTGRYDLIKDVVMNQWIQFLTNLGLLVTEFTVFNSIDASALSGLILNIGDSIGKGKYKEIDIEKNLMNTPSDFSLTDVMDIFSLMKLNEEDMKKVTDIKNREGLTESTLIKTAYDILCNKTYLTIVDAKTGQEIYRAEKEEDLKNAFDEIDGRETGIRFTGSSQLSNLVIEEIDKKIKEVYNSPFILEAEVKNLKEKKEGIKTGKLIDEGEWEKIECKEPINKLEDGDMPSIPYYEEWNISWRKIEIYEDNGQIHEVSYTMICILNFSITVPYQHNIKNVFNEVEVMLDNEMHTDDNLQILRKYVCSDFIKFRNELVEKNVPVTESTQKIVYEKITEEDKSKISWIQTEVEKSLRKIIEKIRNDREYYEKKREDVSSLTAFNGKNLMSIEDIDKERENLLLKFMERKNEYIAKYMENGLFKSAGAKVIYLMEKWFLDKIESSLKDITEDAKSKINEKLSDEGFSYNDFEELQHDYGDILNIGSIHLGLPIELRKEWRENITISINSNPSYFCTDNDNLEIKSVCMFGSGFPLLLTPLTPWIVTINLWTISVKGSWKKFVITDTENAAIYTPLVGYREQQYVRESRKITDPLNNVDIGFCKPISFHFDTFIFVFTFPRLPIGDLESPIEE